MDLSALASSGGSMRETREQARTARDRLDYNPPPFEDDEFDVKATAYDSGSGHFAWTRQLYDGNGNYVDHPSGQAGTFTRFPAKTYNGEQIGGLPKYVRIRRRGPHPSYGLIYEIINPPTGSEYRQTGFIFNTNIPPSSILGPSTDISHDRITGEAGQWLLHIMLIAQANPSSGGSIMTGGLRKLLGTEVIHGSSALGLGAIETLTMLFVTQPTTSNVTQQASHWTFGFEFSTNWELQASAFTFGNGTSNVVTFGTQGGISRWVLTKLR